MVLRASLCAHCRREAAAETCAHCGSAVCPGCARDDATCTVPRVRVLRLGLGRRLRRVDPAGRVGLVSRLGWRFHGLFDLVAGKPAEAPCRVPVLQASWVPAIAQDGRVIWPELGEPDEQRDFTMFRGLIVGSVHGGVPRGIAVARPAQPHEIGLSPTGRHAWIRTGAETAQIWDLDTGAQREYTPFAASVLQATALDSARNLLASGTYGRVNVLRLEGDSATQLGLLHLRDADNVWIALSETCLAVVSDLRGHQGYTIRAFALDADGVPERAPFHVVPEVGDEPPAERRLQRPLVASLSQDGRYLAVAMGDRDIAVHDLQRGSVQRLSGHTDRIAMISFITGSRSLVTSDYDNRVILWPRRDGVFLDLAPDQRR